MKNTNLAFVFPGQGSQSVGMLALFAQSYPEVAETFAKASEVLAKDLWKLVNEGPTEALNETQNTQPAMLAAGVATWEIWNKNSSVTPAWMAGHSLGEYTALVCSGALAFEDAILLVAERGRLMQEAVPAGSGAMAAIIGLDDDAVISLCAETADNEVVAAVNFNAPGQVVIAGNTGAVDRAITAAKDAGAKRAVKLPVSVPSHCALMQLAAQQLEQYLQQIPLNLPSVNLIHNVDVAVQTSPAAIKRVLKAQLYQPVRWVDSIKYMQDQGVTGFVECGPGKVLMSLNKRIAKAAHHFTLNDPKLLAKALEHMHE